MSPASLQEPHTLNPESRRKPIKYLVWEKDGVLHRLCEVESRDALGARIGHTGEWLINVLAGRKVILYRDMVSLCKVLAELHGKPEPWDSRFLFPHKEETFGASMFRTVARHDSKRNRVILDRFIMPVGTKVKVSTLEDNA